MTMRMNKTERQYQDARNEGTLVPLGQEPKLDYAPDFEYWTIVDNRFPHDRHHYDHVLIVLKRDCSVAEVSLIELAELWHKILPWADDKFDYVKLNLSSLRSVKNTPHLHLLVLKEDYK